MKYSYWTKTPVKNEKILLSLLIFSIVSCSSRYKIENDYKLLFQKYKITETIGITVFADPEPIGYLLKSEELVPNAELIKAPEPSHQNTELSSSNYKFVPENSEYRYLGPELTSPNKAVTVLSCIKKGGPTHPSDIFQLFDNENKTITYAESLENQYVINGIAWSPDSKMFVLLCTKSIHKMNLNILGALAGHPTSTRDWYLLFYKNNGDFIFKTKIVSALTAGYLNVVWGKEENILLTTR